MDGTVVERIPGVWDAEETSTLLESRRTEAGHLLQLCATRESAVLLAVFNDILGECRTETAHVC